MSLSSPLPTRNISSPPTSGGFYRLPKTPGSLGKSPTTQRNGTLPSLVLLLDKPKKDFRAEVQRIAKVKIPPRKNFKYFHKFENIQAEESVATETKPIPLLNSFSSHSCFLGVDNRKSVEVQTEPSPIARRDFADLKDYRKWGNNDVDPFIKDLRKVLMSHKPVSIEQYIIAYCQAKLSGDPVPETVDIAKEAALANLNRKISTRNTITTKNSLIKVRSTKSTAVDPVLVAALDEQDAHSENERDSVGGTASIQEDYQSLSDDNASEISEGSY